MQGESIHVHKTLSSKRMLPGLQLPLIELTKNFLGPCDQKNSNRQLERGVQLEK